MRVFKFGGASVKDAIAVRNAGKVLELFPDEDLVVVVSAMGKTTNALEELLDLFLIRNPARFEKLEAIRSYHFEILGGLFPDGKDPVLEEINDVFNALGEKLKNYTQGEYDFQYDQMTCLGELISTKIVSAWLNANGCANKWFDAREFVLTGSDYRNATVKWEKTRHMVRDSLMPFFRNDDAPRHIAITQGFIGSDPKGNTTTLGREGSDFSGAVLAYVLDAKDLTVWKDVPGVLNTDPKEYPNARKLPHISYREAIELSYFGASVIHPKTIQPLENKGIPLFVKSFVDPTAQGTRIDENMDDDRHVPSFIFKRDQVLISITPKDFSFIVERNLSDIFETFAHTKVKINLIQNSAINFSACVDADRDRFPNVVKALQQRYSVRYNEGLELLTIRHYNKELLNELTTGKEVLLEQRSRETTRFVMRYVKSPYVQANLGFK